jgi:hypothetical protein
MNDSPTAEEKRKSRLRWITLGEAIAIAALIVSAAGVWIGWKSSSEDGKPTTIVEKREPIPLILRGKARNDGRTLEISPVENSHALQSVTVSAPGAAPIEVGSDGELGAADLQRALGDKAADGKGTHRVRVRIAARYVEAGADKSVTGSYVISYRWEGGGLFGGRSLRLTGISKA